MMRFLTGKGSPAFAQKAAQSLTPLDAALLPLRCGQECFNRFFTRLKAFLAELFPTFFRYKAHQHTSGLPADIFSVCMGYVMLCYVRLCCGSRMVPTWFHDGSSLLSHLIQPPSAACPRCMICLCLFILSLYSISFSMSHFCTFLHIPAHFCTK